MNAFTNNEEKEVQKGLEYLVKGLQRTNVVEEDWTKIYCDAKGIPNPGLSNLPFRDVLYDGIGIEFKLVKRKKPFNDFGKRIGHPSATRAIDYDPSKPADDCMHVIFEQWCAQIEDFEKRVSETSVNGSFDIRWGILLWAADHKQFVYFEKPIEKPQPKDFVAHWHCGKHRGNPTRNLWIYQKNTNIKEFSITLPKNGAKIQPSFDVPNSDGAYFFNIDVKETKPFFVLENQLDSIRNIFGDVDDDEVMKQLLDKYMILE